MALEEPMVRLLQITLAIIVGTLAAIVYALRVLVLMERRVSRMDENSERMSSRIITEELKIERSLKIRKKKKK
jgi:hypothetical protein